LQTANTVKCRKVKRVLPLGPFFPGREDKAMNLLFLYYKYILSISNSYTTLRLECLTYIVRYLGRECSLGKKDADYNIVEYIGRFKLYNG
jgi:hypothetical protein